MTRRHRPRRTSAALASALLLLSAAPGTGSGSEPRIVEITARRFAFTPAEVALAKGEPVILRLRSLDVTHGFFQRALGIDAEIEPGKVTDVAITPREAGRFLTICDHFCGSGHANMKVLFVVE
jgi:cytochrome c oxidase subunit II